MCVYCFCGDFTFRHDPPWRVPPNEPYIPQPVKPWQPDQQPWSVDKLKEFEDLLRRVKDLEDQVGCPCEPNKADYLGLLKDRIAKLEKAAKKTKQPPPPPAPSKPLKKGT
jgi:hypothetical protein